MKPHDPWSILAKRAGRAPALNAAEMPLGFDTRVLAAVRALRLEREMNFDLLKLFRQMVGAGAAIFLISLALNFKGLMQTPDTIDLTDDPVTALYLEHTP